MYVAHFEDLWWLAKVSSCGFLMKEEVFLTREGPGSSPGCQPLLPDAFQPPFPGEKHPATTLPMPLSPPSDLSLQAARARTPSDCVPTPFMAEAAT